MKATLRKAKAELSRMVRLAQEGQEVIVTVRGKPAARLLGYSDPASVRSQKRWLRRLAAIRKETAGSSKGRSTDQILLQDRKERRRA